MKNAEPVSQLLRIVGDPGEIRVGEPLVRLAPGEVDMGGIGRSADQHRVAVREILVQLAITDDLGRADEGEVLRPLAKDLPLPVRLAEIDRLFGRQCGRALLDRKISEEHTSELQSLMRISYALFFL